MKSKPEIPPFEEDAGTWVSKSNKLISLIGSSFLAETFFFFFLSSSDSLDELDEEEDCFLFFSFLGSSLGGY